MGSSYIRAVGEKMAEENKDVDGSASRLLTLAVKLDSQNWRAWKGMGDLFYQQRYHSLDREEKLQLAGREKEWFERALRHNPQEPEVLAGLARSLIFLGRNMNEESTVSLDDSLGSEAGNAASSESFEAFQERGLELLREVCRYRKFNDTYWWRLGVELRKAEQYEEAIEVFQYAETLTRTPSIRGNILWLKRQLSGETEELAPKEQLRSSNLRLQSEVVDLDEVLKRMK
jgi:tetratricopeptide (TPR) repeat protein